MYCGGEPEAFDVSFVVGERLNIIMKINPYLSMNVQQRVTVGKR